jgi:hypothetical protein
MYDRDFEILQKNGRYYIRYESFILENNGKSNSSYYEKRFVTEGFFGLKKKSFINLIDAEEYIDSIKSRNEGYKLIKKID